MICKENEKIIEQLEKQDEELKNIIVETEDILIKEIEDETKYDKAFHKKELDRMKNAVINFRDWIMSVNEKIINENGQVNMRVQNLKEKLLEQNSIEFMDMPINMSIHAVRLFYKKLNEKCKENMCKKYMLGIVRPLGSRRLNLQELEENDYRISMDLDYLIALVYVKSIFEQMINLVKCILCNYVVNKQDVEFE